MKVDQAINIIEDDDNDNNLVNNFRGRNVDLTQVVNAISKNDWK